MKPLSVGSMCTGYGGLEMGLAEVLDTEVAWVADNDPGKAKILAHHYAGVPNLGDLAKVEWSKVNPVDVVLAGFPCKDVSLAGTRQGLHAHTRSGVWTEVARGIEALHPSLVIIENVRGLLSAEAANDLEPCPWCMGEVDPKHYLRALGAVLGNLADLGFDAVWTGFRAADIGAPHPRFRVFILAWPVADAHGEQSERRRIARVLGNPTSAQPGKGDQWERAGHTAWDRGEAVADATDLGHERLRNARGRRAGSADRDLATADTERNGLQGEWSDAGAKQERAATSVIGCGPAGGCGPSTDADRSGQRAHERDVQPGKSDAHRSATPNSQGDGRDEGRPEPARQLGRSDAALGGTEAVADTPSLGCSNESRGGNPQLIVSEPGAGGGDSPGSDTSGIGGDDGHPDIVEWGPYTAAIRRWEQILGRPVPRPTEPGQRGKSRLNPAFSEWMMGLPAGHVTAVPGLSRNQMLTAIGDGVVPQQAAAALRLLLPAVLDAQREPAA